jgi:hypothetical protein
MIGFPVLSWDVERSAVAGRNPSGADRGGEQADDD